MRERGGYPKNLDKQFKKWGLLKIMKENPIPWGFFNFNSIKRPYFRFHLLHAPTKMENLWYFYFYMLRQKWKTYDISIFYKSNKENVCCVKKWVRPPTSPPNPRCYVPVMCTHHALLPILDSPTNRRAKHYEWGIMARSSSWDLR